MPEEYLTLRDVSELLKLSDKTVYRLAQRGDIPAFKAGGSWRFRRMDIDDWASAQVEDRTGYRPSSAVERSAATSAKEDIADGDV
jgi:excisionase family DNA binding protein